MQSINWGRVILGGLLAGVILNVLELILNLLIYAEGMEAALEVMGVEQPGTAWMVTFVILAFVIGCVISFLYAAMRPRLGAGPFTALAAGDTVWFLAWLWPTLMWIAYFPTAFPLSLMVLALVLSFIEVQIAALAAGWVYKEEPAMA